MSQTFLTCEHHTSTEWYTKRVSVPVHAGAGRDSTCAGYMCTQGTAGEHTVGDET